MPHFTTYDESLIPLIIEGLENHVGKENAITSKQIVKSMRAKGHKINDVQLRSIIHTIRVEYGKLIVGDVHGFYMARTHSESIHQIRSMKSRINEIKEVYDALVKSHQEQFKQVEINI